jgi:hypothetical protein
MGDLEKQTSYEDLRVGDRIEYIGPESDAWVDPRPGERGTITGLNPQDDIVTWDRVGPWAGGLRYLKIRRVESSDEPE